MDNIKVSFDRFKSFDTLEEAKEYTSTFADKVVNIYKAEYPNCVFYYTEVLDK